ncbi:MAG: polyhydroxyalkanoate synthesis protein PhaF [Geodermatophilaceae bacterium]|nr:polyhydroxyalkanoate synthesis protein PhaF [Geodermatophilaceae bacterium]
MVRDAVRGYWALASGLTDITRQKATAAARALVSQGEATAEQVGAIAEDLISTSLSNRAALLNIVRVEVDRARSAMGVATSSELDALTRRIAVLESQLAAVRDGAVAATAAQASAAQATAAQATAAKVTAAKVTAAKVTAAKHTGVAPRQTAAMPAEEPQATKAKRTAARKTAAKVAAATKKAATTEAAVKKAAAKKATPRVGS